MKRSRISFETLGYLLVIVITAPFAWESNKLPPGVFDPLGSGTVPLIVSLLILGLCSIGLVRTLLSDRIHRRTDVDVSEGGTPTDSVVGHAHDEKNAIRKTPQLVLMLLAATVLYCCAFQLRIANFALMSTVFLWVSIYLLSDRSRKNLVGSLVVAIACSTLFYIVFTKVFIVDLPGT
jgi:hypothetical protein